METSNRAGVAWLGVCGGTESCTTEGLEDSENTLEDIVWVNTFLKPYGTTQHRVNPNVNDGLQLITMYHQ